MRAVQVESGTFRDKIYPKKSLLDSFEIQSEKISNFCIRTLVQKLSILCLPYYERTVLTFKCSCPPLRKSIEKIVDCR